MPADPVAPTLELVDPRTLTPHPRNPRQGDVGAIVESIRETGWHGVIVGQASTRQVVAGWHRTLAAAAITDAIEAGEDEWVAWAADAPLDPVAHGVVPVEWQELDDDTAVRKLVADNRTNDLAAYDDHALAELLADLATTDTSLAGTGFDGQDLDRMIADLDADADSILGEPVQAPRRHGQSLILTFENQEALAELTAILERLGAETYSEAVLRLAREWANSRG